MKEDPADGSLLPIRNLTDSRSTTQVADGATYLSLAQGCIHAVSTERCKPHRIESPIALKYVYLVDQGVKRAAGKLVGFDVILLEIVRPDFCVKAGDYAEVMTSASHGPPKIRVAVCIDADGCSVGQHNIQVDKIVHGQTVFALL